VDIAQPIVTVHLGLPEEAQRRSNLIQRTANPAPTAIHHMGVDHGRGHVAVAQQFLHRADVVTRLQQVGSEGVAPMPMSE